MNLIKFGVLVAVTIILTSNTVFAAWKFNPHTGKLDYYESTANSAPNNADYLVGTTNASLSAEIVVGTTPGGILGGTWASPTIDIDSINDTHIDWGTGANQVSADDIPDGATNAIITLTQETNFETAYTHSQDNTQAHSDYLLNTTDQLDGDLTIDNTSTTALVVQKNAGSTKVLQVDSSASFGRVQLFDNEELVLSTGLNDGLLLYYQTSGEWGQITTQGVTNLHLSSGSGIIYADDTMIIDGTSTEAFLVRQNADAADVFNIDTTNKETEIDTTLLFNALAAHFSWTNIVLTSTTTSETFLWTVDTDQQCSAWSMTCAGADFTSYLDLDTTGVVEGDNFLINVSLAANCGVNDHFIIRKSSGGATLKDIVGDSTSQNWGIWAFYFGSAWRAFWTVKND